jgi:hypothetical protein
MTRSIKTRNKKPISTRVKNAFIGANLMVLGAVGGCGGDTIHNHYPAPDSGLNKPAPTSVSTECTTDYSNKCKKEKNKASCILLPEKAVEFDGLVFKHKQNDEGIPFTIEVIDNETGCNKVVGEVEFQSFSLGGQNDETPIGLVTICGTTYVVKVHAIFELNPEASYENQQYAIDFEVLRINGENTCEEIGGPIIQGGLKVGESLDIGSAEAIKNGNQNYMGFLSIKLADISRLADGSKEVSLDLIDIQGNVIKNIVMDNNSMAVVEVNGDKTVLEAWDAFMGDTFGDKGVKLAVYGCL